MRERNSSIWTTRYNNESAEYLAFKNLNRARKISMAANTYFLTTPVRRSDTSTCSSWSCFESRCSSSKPIPTTPSQYGNLQCSLFSRMQALPQLAGTSRINFSSRTSILLMCWHVAFTLLMSAAAWLWRVLRGCQRLVLIWCLELRLYMNTCRCSCQLKHWRIVLTYVLRATWVGD